jgi:hypothetical protein
MGKIRSVYVLFGINPRIWNGLRTYTEVPLYYELIYVSVLAVFSFSVKKKNNLLGKKANTMKKITEEVLAAMKDFCIEIKALVIGRKQELTTYECL